MATAPRRKERLRSAVGWSLAGQMAFALSQFLVLSLIAKFAGLQSVGQYSYAAAFATPVFLCANLGLQLGQATDIGDRYAFGHYLALRILTTSTGLVVLLILAFTLRGEAMSPLIFVAVALTKAAETLCTLFYGQFQKADRVTLIARSQILRCLFAMPLFAAVLITTQSTAAGVFAMAAAWAGVALLHDRRRTRALVDDMRARFEWPVLGRLLKLAAPMAGGNLMRGFGMTGPRLVTAWVLGVEALGLFAVVSHILTVGTMAISAVTQSLLSRFARLFQEGRRQVYWQTAARLSLVLGFGGLAGVPLSLLLGELFVDIAFGPEFERVVPLLPVAALALGLKGVASVLQSAFSSQRRFRVLALMRSFDAAFIIAAAGIGAAFFGLDGVVWALVVSAAIQVVTVVLFLRTTSPAGFGEALA